MDVGLPLALEPGLACLRNDPGQRSFSFALGGTREERAGELLSWFRRALSAWRLSLGLVKLGTRIRPVNIRPDWQLAFRASGGDGTLGAPVLVRLPAALCLLLGQGSEHFLARFEVRPTDLLA